MYLIIATQSIQIQKKTGVIFICQLCRNTRYVVVHSGQKWNNINQNWPNHVISSWAAPKQKNVLIYSALWH